jgi:hypothetical protein
MITGKIGRGLGPSKPIGKEWTKKVFPEDNKGYDVLYAILDVNAAQMAARKAGYNLRYIDAGKYKMSIQGSASHYCTPKKIVPIEQYSSMEIMLYGEDWAEFDPAILDGFPEQRYLESCNDGSSMAVYGWVDIAVINRLYKYLKRLK